MSGGMGDSDMSPRSGGACRLFAGRAGGVCDRASGIGRTLPVLGVRTSIGDELSCGRAGAVGASGADGRGGDTPTRELGSPEVSRGPEGFTSALAEGLRAGDATPWA